MEKISSKSLTRKRVLGLVVMGLGVIVLFSPIVFGEWIVSLLGGVLIAAGLIQFVQTIRTKDETASNLSYVTSVILILLGLVIFATPNVALFAILLTVTLFLFFDGGVKLYGAYIQKGADRWWSLFNGLFSIGLGAFIWFLASANFGLFAIGIVIGLKLIVQGWTMFFQPEKHVDGAPVEIDPREHPDTRLRLKPSDIVGERQSKILESDSMISWPDIIWCLTLFSIFFVIHAIRTDAHLSVRGLITPFTAVIGDIFMALILGIILILPFRLLWRWGTRPVERGTWNRYDSLREKGQEGSWVEKGLGLWLFERMRFSVELRNFRGSLNYTFWRLLRFGIPLTLIFISVNFLWGFSWYFNSENWASGVFQAITKTRVDPWRKAMTEATEKAALDKGVPPEKVFAIEPEGVTNEGDFSFVVIGDTGEGDSSQMILRKRLIAANNREDVKFLVLSSDVIYPDGKMKDYEFNFYLPFMGFEKPLYSIPGNHDWYDANEGFNANFFDGESAYLAITARLNADYGTAAPKPEEEINAVVAEAKRLREYYGVKNGLQRAPYFDMHVAGFSLIAVDTGILRSLDEKEKAWLEASLTRAATNFKMVVLGHPFYVAGEPTGEDVPSFVEIYQTLQKYNVNIVMAGDTHDFEFYKMKYASTGGEKEMFHFVNGGGGAYLSIGSSVGFPAEPVTPNYMLYPRADEVTEKINNEVPFWKKPFLIWLERFKGWPFGQEMVSGAFDFNRAPFFQSFLEIKVERSQNRVRLLLWGVNGQLRWRDVQLGGDVKPADKSDDDFVEFILPLAAAPQ